jgi:hypothetical protein
MAAAAVMIPLAPVLACLGGVTSLSLIALDTYVRRLPTSVVFRIVKCDLPDQRSWVSMVPELRYGRFTTWWERPKLEAARLQRLTPTRIDETGGDKTDLRMIQVRDRDGQYVSVASAGVCGSFRISDALQTDIAAIMKKNKTKSTAGLTAGHLC